MTENLTNDIVVCHCCPQTTISYTTDSKMHITISITAPRGVVIGQDLVTIDLAPDTTLADLKVVIQSETNLATPAQIIYHNGRVLSDDSQTLSQYQVKEDDMLALSVHRPQASSSEPSRSAQGGQTRGAASAGRRQGGQDPEPIRLQALSDPRVLQQIRSLNPELADAVPDAARFRQLLEHTNSTQQQKEADKQRELALLNEDPFNVDAQQKIEEIIRQERVMENLQDAMDYTPEVFGRVTMLYIDVEVNNHKVKAFVDSGAQITIMSPTCAEKCGIMRLIDKRYFGIVRGVGTAMILGRVHSAQIKVGNLFLPVSFTVTEGKDVDLLLGLDMLRRHQACIDLRKGALIIGGEEVNFLGEADIPKHDEDDDVEMDGPVGTNTGAISQDQSNAPDAQSKGRVPATESSSRTAGEPQGGQQALRRSFPPEDIAKLTDLGFSREEAVHALELAGGNVDMAAGILL